jgi:hypothetical protein
MISQDATAFYNSHAMIGAAADAGAVKKGSGRLVRRPGAGLPAAAPGRGFRHRAAAPLEKTVRYSHIAETQPDMFA